MPEASVGAAALIEWGVATLALPGQAQSGDLHLVKPLGTGVLVAAVDGLGRGAGAARGGIGGSELPRPHPVVLPIAAGDTLIFTTDGIREGFAEALSSEATPQQLADHILARHGKGTDDALVLVARYLGGAGTRG